MIRYQIIFVKQLTGSKISHLHRDKTIILIKKLKEKPIRARSMEKAKKSVITVILVAIGHRCFAVAGPSTWNSLPDSLHDPALSLDMFRCQLKTYLFAKYWRDVLSALEIFDNALYKFTLYLLTYYKHIWSEEETTNREEEDDGRDSSEDDDHYHTDSNEPVPADVVQHIDTKYITENAHG